MSLNAQTFPEGIPWEQTLKLSTRFHNLDHSPANTLTARQKEVSTVMPINEMLCR